MSPDATKKPPTATTSEPPELEHLIRQRAYQLYEARGRQDGHEMEDWYRAKEEIAGKKVRIAA